MTSANTVAVRPSVKEEALWLLETLVPGTGVNNLSLAMRVDRALSLPLVDAALDAVINRHTALRTVFIATEAGLRKGVLDEGRVVRTSRHVVAGDVPAAMSGFVAEPFPLAGEPLIRAGYFEHDSGDYLCLAVHHLIFDTTSALVLREELAAAYSSLQADLPLPDIFAAPEPVADDIPPSQQSLAFWREHLAGARPQELELACGVPDRGEAPTLAGDQVTVELSKEATASIRQLAKRWRAPEAVVLLAAYSALLAGHGAGPDTVIGSPIDIRRPASAGAVGYHVNVLPLRIPHRPEQSFGQLVRRTRDIFFAALSHVDVPVDNLLSEIPRTGSSSRHTLFRHVFNYVPTTGPAEFAIGDARAVAVTVENGSSKFDLEFFLLPSPAGTRLRVVYNSELLRREDARALAARYEALLIAADADADRPLRDIGLMSADDRAVIDSANATAAPDAASVLEAVLAAAAATPERVAVVDGAREITYQQLLRAARATHELLHAHGVTATDRVALHALRSGELAAAVLGVWLAGASYVPLDPDHPRQRVAYQLADADATVVLTADNVAAPPGTAGCRSLPMVPIPSDGEPLANELTAGNAAPGACAYLIYTSGSTGRPKGAVVSHGALANLVAHFATELTVTPRDTTLWMTTFSFDISALELLLPLTTGGRLVIADEQSRTDGAALGRSLRRHDVSIVQATPTTWRLVAPTAADALTDRKVLCGGEPMPVSLARTLLATGCELRNVYGPTETTIWSTSTLVTSESLDDDSTVTIGKPLRNTSVFVVAPDGTELPVKVSGELCIAGAGVADGYHGRPELTVERFGNHPVHGRFYRTGDRARWRPDGNLELLGRTDRQIKLRGNRLELGEIEAVLLAHPQVSAAAVVVAGDTSADGALVAFVEVTGPAQEMTGVLWQHARAELPPSALPHHVDVVPALPTTANNKVNYPELTRRAELWLAGSRDSVAAVEPDDVDDLLVYDIVELFRDLLNSARVDAITNFFTAGGHSLLGAQLAQRLKRSTGVAVRLADVFAHPSPTALAELIRSRRAG